MVCDVLQKYSRNLTRFGTFTQIICFVFLFVAVGFLPPIIIWKQDFTCFPETAKKEGLECFKEKQASDAVLYVTCVCCLVQPFLPIIYSLAVNRHVQVVRNGVKDKLDQQKIRCHLRREERAACLCKVYIFYWSQLFARFVLTLGLILWLLFEACKANWDIYGKTLECALSNNPNSTMVHCHDNKGGPKNRMYFSLMGVTVFVGILTVMEGLWFICKGVNLIPSQVVRKKYYFFPVVDDLEFCLFLLGESMNADCNVSELQNLLANGDATDSVLSQEVRNATRRQRDMIHSQSSHPYTQLESYFLSLHQSSQQLDSLFVEPSVHCGRVRLVVGKYEQREEVIAKGYGKTEGTKLVSFHDILKDTKGKSVALIGRAGIGKTFLVHKLKKDLVKPEHGNTEAEQSSSITYPYDFIFHFKRQHLTESSEPLSFKQLIQRELPGTDATRIDEVFHYIINNSGKILIIFDGVEGHLNNTPQHSCELVDHERAVDITILLKQLITRKLLPRATILTTSRPVGLPTSPSQPEKTYEITGFSPKCVEEFVNKFCEGSSQELKQDLNHHILHTPALLSLCYVPFYCFMVCAFLKWIYTSGINALQEYLPSTASALYEGLIKVVIWNDVRRHGEGMELRSVLSLDLKSFIQSCPESAKSRINYTLLMAFNTIKYGNLVFPKVGSMPNALVGNLPDQQIGVIQFEQICCFSHVTIQEFLAAYYLALKTPFKQFDEFVSTFGPNAMFSLVLQFASGMLRWRTSERHNCLKRLTEVLLANRQSEPNKCKSLFSLSCCLFEGRKVVNEGVLDAENLKECIGGECPAELNCIEHQITDLDLEAFVHSVQLCCQDTFQFTKIVLRSNNIGKRGCEQIGYLLHHNKGPSSVLDLSDNYVNDEGVKSLMPDNRESQGYELRDLHLGENSEITCIGINYVKESILAGQLKNLNTLDLRLVLIDIKSSEHFQEALRSDNCNIETLVLINCGMKDEQLGNIMKGVSTSSKSKLQYLYVSHNGLTSQGMKCISATLQMPTCSLDLLDLAHNKIGDNGVKVLCKQSLRHLKQLILAGNKLSSRSFHCLAEVVKSCHLDAVDISNLTGRDNLCYSRQRAEQKLLDALPTHVQLKL